MTPATAFNTLAQAFKAWMATNYAAVPVAFPDLEFNPPAVGTAWCRWSMQWSGTLSAGIGVVEDRHSGMIFVELFWPSQAGFKAVNEAAAAIAEFHRTYTADGGRLQCKGIDDAARPWVSSPPSDEGNVRRTVNVPVRLMERR